MKKQSLFLFFALTLRVSPLMRLFRHQQSFDWRHFPSSGQSGFFLHLQVSGCCVDELKFERTYLLCDEMTDFILGMHE